MNERRNECMNENECGKVWEVIWKKKRHHRRYRRRHQQRKERLKKASLVLLIGLLSLMLVHIDATFVQLQEKLFLAARKIQFRVVCRHNPPETVTKTRARACVREQMKFEHVCTHGRILFETYLSSCTLEWAQCGVFKRTRSDTRLPQLRAGGQGLYLRSLDHLRRSSEAKDGQNPKQVKCDGRTDGQIDRQTNGPTKQVVESHSTRLKIVTKSYGEWYCKIVLSF